MNDDQAGARCATLLGNRKHMTLNRNFYFVTFFGIAFAYVLYASYHYDNIFRHFFFLVFGLIVLYYFYKNLFDVAGNYRSKKSLNNDSAFKSAVIVILINVGIFCFYELKLHSKTLIKADNYGLYADFKENGQYIIKSGSWASKTHFYGNYKLENSTIILDKPDIDEILSSKKLKIQKSIENGKSKLKLFQLDSNENISAKYSFEIIEDNRK